jgi:signal transduction histidine kinase
MNLPMLLSFLSTTFFACIAIVYVLRESRARSELNTLHQKQQQQNYEVSLLRKIHEVIDYSMDTEKILDVFIGSLGNLYPYSTVSAMTVKKDVLVFKTIAHERISHAFLGRVRNNMLASLSALAHRALPDQLDSRLSGVFLDDTNTHTPKSFFQVPIFVNTTVVGIISVASSKEHAYTKEQMLLVYKLVQQASFALSRIKHTLDTEKEKIMAMVGSLNDGVMMLDPNHEIFVINPKAREFLNIQTAIPTMHELLIAIPNTFDFSAKVSRAIHDRESFPETEVVIGERTVTISISPVLTASGTQMSHSIGASVLLHDITLEKSVAKMKEDFTHIIVHELRSPLTAIKAASQLMVAQGEKFNEQEKNKLLSLINSQARTLLDEVSLILDAAKLQAGLFTVQKLPGDFKKIVTDAVSVFSAQAQSKYVQIIVNLPETIPVISFDDRYIGQVMNNLISNSLKFTPVGGKITIQAVVAEEKLHVSVTDTGIGIPKEKQGTLFNKFSQVRQPNEKTGTGLGLYIVKGIIEAHGGVVGMESEPGHGTKIYFTLPITTGVAETIDTHQSVSEHIVTPQYLHN